METEVSRYVVWVAYLGEDELGHSATEEGAFAIGESALRYFPEEKDQVSIAKMTVVKTIGPRKTKMISLKFR